MSLKNFRKISNKEIHPTSLVFKTYKGDSLVPMGYVTVKVCYKDQILNLNLYIVKENLDTIFGREWLFKINLDWNSINVLKTSDKVDLNSLLKQLKEIFDGRLRKITNYEVNF